MLRVAMLSKWHVHAQEYAQRLSRMPEVQLSCVWDEDPARGKAWAADLQVDFEADLDALLGRKDVDGVVVTTPTTMHEEVMVKAAKAGKHIFTEKVLATTAESAERIIAAIEEAGVQFCICLPYRTQPAMLYIKQAIDEGLLGEITLLRIRNGHDGSLASWLPEYWYDEALAGGGAMMDLGCHPMYLSDWFMGMPERIVSTFTSMHDRGVDENAVCVMEYENKAIAIAETSLVSPFTPSQTEVYGTKGTVIATDGRVRIRSKQLLADGWVEPAKLPKELKHPTRMWVDGILSGEEIVYGLKEARNLTELMDRAYRSDKQKNIQKF